MALCGISRIDDLNSGAATATAIVPGDPDKDSVGVLQQLLAGMGSPGLPNLLSADYGVFGPRTTAAVQNFRAAQGLAAGDSIDSQCLQALVSTPAGEPIVSRGFLTLVLDIPYTGLAKIVSVTAQMEGAGKFAALNLNSDKAGLSFGLIQWAQKPGRLTEILQAFQAADSANFVNIFGAGDAGLAANLIAHTQKIKGGINPATGETTDPAFDLVHDPWVSRFRQAALFKPFQQVQMQTALKDFADSLRFIQGYAPQLTSERAIGFMLDVANQFGDGGLHSIYNSVFTDGISESDLLQDIADATVAQIQDNAKAGTQARRQHFLTTTFLSDDAFANDAAQEVAAD